MLHNLYPDSFMLVKLQLKPPNHFRKRNIQLGHRKTSRTQVSSPPPFIGIQFQKE